jgi:hypothetical protein
MSPKETQRLPETLAEVCGDIPLSDDAKALLTPKIAPASYFYQVVEHKLYRDAVRFVAYFMPKRQAVWWASLCVWQVGRPELAEKEAAALRAAIHWVQNPGEEARRAAEAAGKAAGADTPAGCLALAAFYSEGSLASACLPAVPPPDRLTANAVTGAVLLAGARGKPDQAEDRFRHFLTMAVEILNNRLLWQMNPMETKR